ncbi:hypothetical protein [Chamaesiphon sp. OTE_8_metabat_110]|uniref:hypothetical protein n=2 Tax=unclassified Chamaesiphon TaxID=2620921 RepID=UPI00286A3992|nr:hypothetical protein [Chamaesiphon sp. OTE_8_metabat_110]
MATQSQNYRAVDLIWGIAIVLVSAICAIIVPLTTYAATLATFGIAHVAIELRYIHSRFNRRLNRKTIPWLIALVLAIATIRCVSIWGFIPSNIAQLLELGCGLGLVTIATHYLWIRDWKLGALGTIVGCLLTIGIVCDPIATLVIFAIFHNLTPVGFILERQGFKSPRIIWICGVFFGLLPLIIILYQLVPIVNLPSEINDTYLRAFIAPSWQQSALAYPLFSAVAFLQCMHYAVVIGLFSRWTPDFDNSPIQHPTRYFYLLLGGISMLLFISFQHTFILTRAGYGVVASIHAWIEIPLLLIATDRRLEIPTIVPLDKK